MSRIGDIHEVVRQKELEIERLKKEIKALRTVIPMLEDKETPLAQIYSEPQNGESQSARPNIGRRGLGSNLYRLGVSDKTIQAILRHSNVNVTLGYYVKTASPDVAAAMDET